jgi:lysophospholipase L1-like esterase
VRPRVFIGLLCLAVLAALVVVLAQPDRTSAAEHPAAGSGAGVPCAQVTAAHTQALRMPVTAGAPGLIVVLGDSYSQGHGVLGGRAGGFPALLARGTGRPLYLDGYGSTGFTTRGYCSGRPVTYGERLLPDHLLALRPATVVVEGGVNDARHGDPRRVGTAAADLLRRLAAVPQVIVVGPAAIPNADPARLAMVDDELTAAARAAGRPYLGLRRYQLPMLPDGIHPTGAGQQTIARLLIPLLSGSPVPEDGGLRA